MASTKNNLFVGSAIGSLKGVCVKKEDDVLKVGAKNLLRDKEILNRQNEIKCMNWSDIQQEEILIGTKTTVRSFNTADDTLSNSFELPADESCGIFKLDNKIFVGITSGSLQSVMPLENEPKWTEELKLNQRIERLRQGIVHTNIVATGGKDNDLKLWDLNMKKTTFNAKNIKPDELQLQIPVWVSDIAFCRQNETVATCSRHGYVRLYDPLLPQRRPVFNVHQIDQAFTCLSCAPIDNQFLVGSGTGDLFLVDVRGKNAFVGKYKGFTGAIKEVVCPSNQSLVFSVSFDRYFRIHDFSTRKLVLKEYMQTRLTTVLPKEPFVVEEIKTVESEPEDDSADLSKSSNKKNEISEKDVEIMDNIFDEMEKIDDANAKKSSTPSNLKRKKAVKTVEAPADDPIEPNKSSKRIKWKKNF